MANTTRTRPRTSSSTARGRFPRPGGTTQTARGRFPRPAASQTRRTPARPRIPGRRAQKPSGIQGMMGKLPGLSTGGRKSSGGNKGKFGAAALLAGAAGFAMRNRDKLPGPLGRKDSGTQPAGAPPER